MRADNKTTDHNRTIKLTDVPTQIPGSDYPGLSELTITISYATMPNDVSRAEKAVTLDNVVIPAIIAAINGGA